MADIREESLLNRITLERLLNQLEPWERELLILLMIDEVPPEEVGQIIAERHNRKVIKGATVRYHKDRLIGQLKQLANES